MIVRGYAKCNSCDHEYIIRFNVGNKFPQTGTFPCKECGELLTFGYDAERETIYQNLTKIDDNNTGTIINIHPELPIDPTSKNDPLYFPSIDFIVKHGKEKKGDFFEFRAAQRSCVSYVESWDKIATDFRYLKENRIKLLEEKYGKNFETTKSKIFKSVLTTGRFFLEGKWYDLYRQVLNEAEKAKKHTNFEKLKTYLNGLKDDILLKKMYTMMEQYRKVEPELLSTLLSQKCNMKPKGHSSSADWGKIEMIYGNLYEVYGDLLIIPTIINNLLTRGDFEQFATPGFTIDKYIDTDKAGRCANFAANANLHSLEDFYDAGLRNGTHHKASEFGKDDQEIIIKTGKGGRNERLLTMVEYIEFCNELYARCLILFNITYKLLM